MQKKIHNLFARVLREIVLRLYSKNYFQLTPSTPSISKNQFVGYFVAIFKEKKKLLFFKIILALIFHAILLVGKNRAGAIPAQRREKGLNSSWIRVKAVIFEAGFCLSQPIWHGTVISPRVMLLLLLFLLPLLSQFRVLLVEAALFRDTKPRVSCVRAQHILVKLVVQLRASWTAHPRVFYPKMLLAAQRGQAARFSSRQPALQALVPQGLWKWLKHKDHRQFGWQPGLVEGGRGWEQDDI